MTYNHLQADPRCDFARGAALVAAVALFFITLSSYLDRPQIFINSLSGECEKVISKDASHTCANIDQFKLGAEFIYSNNTIAGIYK